MELNPFVIEANTDTATDALYSVHNANNELSLFDPASNTGQITQQWLEKRTEFLERVNWFNIENIDPVDPSFDTTAEVVPGQEPGTFQKESKYFADVRTGCVIQQGRIFDNTEHYYFGDLSAPESALAKPYVGRDGADYLFGGSGKDRFDAGGGVDYLEGGAGDDTLYGGKGFDTYRFNPGNGHDVISDSDGSGKIVVGDCTLVGTGPQKAQFENGRYIWVDQANDFRYELDRQNTLVITGDRLGAESRITIEKFDRANNTLGIYLNLEREARMVALGDANPFAINSGTVTTASHIAENGAQVLKVVLNQAASAGDIVSLSASGADASLLAVTTGDNTVSLGFGSVNLVLQEGQTEVTFLVSNTGDLDEVANYLLQATWQAVDPTETSVSTSYDLTVNGVVESSDTLTGGNLILGDNDADDLSDTELNDRIITFDGDDVVHRLKGGDDIVELGDGDDVLVTYQGVTGRVQADGGAGRDYLGGGEDDDLIVGGDGPDALYGGGGDDRLYGGVEGNTADFIAAGAVEVGTGLQGEWFDAEGGRDLIFGGAGNDLVTAGDGNDLVATGGGSDWIWGDANSFNLDGNNAYWNWAVTEVVEMDANGVSTYSYELTNMSWEGFDGAGDDVIYAGAGDDVVHGERGNDTIYLESGNDKAWGGEGDDAVFGGDGNDLINGDNAGSQLAPELHGNDFLDGGAGDDILHGNGGADAVFGGAGNDTLVGDAEDLYSGDDYLDGEDGDDIISGAGGSDTLYGGLGDDYLFGDSDDSGVGYQGDDLLDGEDGNDTLVGGGGADTLLGGAGADFLYGESANTPTEMQGDDYLDGGAGNDELVGGGGSDTLVGGDGDDALYGEASETPVEKFGDDDLRGGAGNDLLVGGGANDWLDGGDGNDRLYGDVADIDEAEHGDDILDGGAGDDVLIGMGGSDVLVGGDGADDLLGDAVGLSATAQGDDVLDGGAGDDVLVGFGGDDVLLGGDGADQASGGDGNDVLSGGAGNDSLYGEAGDDLIDGGADNDVLVGGSGADYLAGDGGNDSLYGGSGDDTLEGGDGDDTLVAGAGQDTLSGGDGVDLYVYDLGDGVDTIVDVGSNTLRFGTGIGVANLSLALGSLAIKVGDGGDQIHIDNFLPDNPYASVAIDRFEFADGTVLSYSELLALGFDLDGSEQGDVIYGTALTDRINSLGGNDTVYGLADDDVIDGGTGADTLYGGEGNDEYHVDVAGDSVVELAGEGYDKVVSSVNRVLSENVEALTLTGSAQLGTGNDLDNTLTGNEAGNILMGLDGDDSLVGNDGDDHLLGGAGSDTLFGGAGADILDGGSGADVMAGGAGDDTFIVDAVGDSVTEDFGSGTDTVLSSVSFTLGANLENLTLTGMAAIDASGNALANVLSGNDAANSLLGNGGDDTLYGFAGNDRLSGGQGADTLVGGEGDDSYVVNDLSDTLVEVAGGGIDTVESTVSYTLASHLENLTLGGSQSIDGNGNEAANILLGNSGRNLLDGGAGADRMAGGAGDDTYVVDDAGDSVVESAGQGTDTVYSSISYTLADNVEHLTLTGAASIDGIGNALRNIIVGNGADNTLDGGDGNDTLCAGDGDDVVVGGDGVDGLYGDAGDDRLIGGADDDLLDGGTGIDSMVGGTGNDKYFVDDSADTAVEDADAGHDWVYSEATFTLGANIECLRLTAGTAIDGTGNDLDNRIIGGGGDNRLSGLAGDDLLFGDWGQDTLDGGDGDDVLDGGYGDDQLAGGAGNDQYYVESTGDTVIEAADAGTDTVNAWVSHTLSDNVEVLLLVGEDSTNGAGNASDNQIFGTNTANTLSGEAGDDFLDGRAGNDTLLGGVGDDTLYGGDDGYGPIEDEYGYGGNYGLEPNDDFLDGGVGDDRLDGGSGNDTLFGGDGDDYLYGGDDGLIDNYGGYDGYGGYGGDLSNNDFLDGGNGVDQMFGGTGQDWLNGGADADTLDGGSGNDLLDGGTGLDVMSGGTGDDFYYVDGYAEVIEHPGVPGDDCTDDHGKGNEGVGNGYDGPPPGHDYNQNDCMGTTPGNPGSKTGTCNQGNDSREHDSRSADDDCGGDSSTSTASGWGDFGLASCDPGIPAWTEAVWHTDTVIEADGAGHDVVYGMASFVLPDFVEELHLIGSEAIDATGNGQSNLLVGNDASNVLDGAGGADMLVGGWGDDTYVVDDLDDLVLEWANAGNDTIETGIGYVLAEHLENLRLTGETAVDGVGNAGDNVLSGNAADNQLQGLDGDDTLSGGAGNDVLDGGLGDDTYIYRLGDGLDRIIDTAGLNTLLIGGGLGLGNVAVRYVDTSEGALAQLRLVDIHGNEVEDQGVDFLLNADGSSPIATIRFDSGDQTAVLDISVGTATYEGTRRNDRLVGTHFDDTLNGNRGRDRLAGAGGHDTLLGGEGVDELFGDAGNDRLFGGDDADALAGGFGYDVLSGDAGNDTLMGGQQNDLLLGGSGNDELSGGEGQNLVAGGEGDDRIALTGSHEVVLFNRGDGDDRLTWGAYSDNFALSLGDGIELDDLSLRRQGRNLILAIEPAGGTRRGRRGHTDELSFSNWYAQHAAPVPHVTLQIIADTTSGGAIERFDFTSIVTAFDNRRNDGWSFADATLDSHLDTSDSEAIGGAIAYGYATGIDPTGLAPTILVDTLRDARLGHQGQAITG